MALKVLLAPSSYDPLMYHATLTLCVEKYWGDNYNVTKISDFYFFPTHIVCVYMYIYMYAHIYCILGPISL